MEKRIIGFHIDMNVAQFRRDYLEQWLKYLAEAGYNTVLWEVENNIRWETVPECVSPDAFTKDEFAGILSTCRSLGLEPIPLLQVLGHAEYVLKHQPYAGLRESPDRIDQYCPLHPEVVPLLQKWIGEYLEVFGDVKRFHLGADEAYQIGRCPKCSSYADEKSISDLYIQHVNAVAQPLRDRGVKPAIWCDMVLAHPEAIQNLSRDITVFDWYYNHHRGSDKFRVWGEGTVAVDEISETAINRFGKFMFPEGGREKIDVFYTTEYLKSEGFEVVTCPSSASAGDNVFSPRLDLHERNTWDFGGKGLKDASGTLLTSWTVRIHPWELQKSCIDIPGYQTGNPEASIDDFRSVFARDTFGTEPSVFYEAASCLEGKCLYDTARTLGFDKSCLPVPEDHILNDVRRLVAEGKTDEIIADAREKLHRRQKGRSLLSGLMEEASGGKLCLESWMLAAEALVHRARAVLFLFTREQGRPEGDGKELVRELDEIEARFRSAYRAVQRPVRTGEIDQWVFGSLRHALESE